MQTASLEWVEVVQDLFLEGASADRIVAFLDGTAVRGDSHIAVKSMRAIAGFDCTLLLSATGRPRSLSVWYRDLDKPTLAAAEAIFGRATLEPKLLFELVFDGATRDLEDGTQLVVSCSATANASRMPSTERLLVGLALSVMP